MSPPPRPPEVAAAVFASRDLRRDLGPLLFLVPGVLLTAAGVGRLAGMPRSGGL